jgi:hypothetical protein
LIPLSWWSCCHRGLKKKTWDKRNEGLVNRQLGEPPTKWEVYEQILRVPYYVVFDRYTDQLRVFALNGGHYEEQSLLEPKIWLPELKLGLGLWRGSFQGIHRIWLRWYDSEGNWIPTDTEAAELAQQQAELA